MIAMMLSGTLALQVKDVSSETQHSHAGTTSEEVFKWKSPSTLVSNTAKQQYFSALDVKYRSARHPYAEPYNFRLPLIIGTGLAILLLVVMLCFTFVCVPKPPAPEQMPEADFVVCSNRLKALREALPLASTTTTRVTSTHTFSPVLGPTFSPVLGDVQPSIIAFPSVAQRTLAKNTIPVASGVATTSYLPPASYDNLVSNALMRTSNQSVAEQEVRAAEQRFVNNTTAVQRSQSNPAVRASTTMSSSQQVRTSGFPVSAQQFNMATPTGTQRFSMATPHVSGLSTLNEKAVGGLYAKGWLAEQGSIANLNFATSQPVTGFGRSSSASPRMVGPRLLGASV